MRRQKQNTEKDIEIERGKMYSSENIQRRKWMEWKNRINEKQQKSSKTAMTEETVKCSEN